MKLVTVMEHAELVRLQPLVVVECWAYVGFGRGKRLFEKEFNEEERKRAAIWAKACGRWHGGWTGGGVPDSHAMSISDYNFALRVVNFLAKVKG